jgi:uroporphyrinogen decarboxylase
MSGKEILLEAMRLGRPRRVPVSLWGGGVFAMDHAGCPFEELATDPQRTAEAIISVNAQVGSDAVFPGSGFVTFPVRALGGSAEVHFKGTGAPALVGAAIESLEQVDDLDLGRIASDEVVNAVWETTRLVRREVGEETLVGLVTWGPLTFASRVRGVEPFMVDTVTDPEGVERLLEFSTEAVWLLHRPLLEEGTAEVVALADPVASGDLISNKSFRQFALPYLREITRRIGAAGGLTMLHICGKTEDRLDLIAESGVSLFSLDHRVDLGKAKEALAGRVCLAGNVAPVDLLLNGTPQEVEKASRACVEAAAEGGGYVLMPGCDLPPHVPLENVRAMVRVARGDW